MGKYKKLKVISSMPFFIIGALFIIGAIWLAVDRLMEGLVWYESDGFVIGWLIVLLILGAAFASFGRNILLEGYSQITMPLISSKIYYFVGVLLIVIGIWSTLFGSLQALIVVAVGAGIIIYGREISRKEKVLNLIMSSGHWNEGGADNKNINEQSEKEQQNIDATYMSIVYALMEGDIEKANNHLNDGFGINQLSSESDQCLLPLILGQGKGELLVKLARIVSKKETCSEDERQQSKNLVELHDKIDRGALFLIEHGADIFAKDVNDRTPLMVAAKNGLINSLISLIDAGSDLNYQRDDGRTALMDAVSERGVESVRILLDSGATKNLQDKNGKIALDFVHELDDEIRSLLSS